MRSSHEHNFAACLIDRLGANSFLVDAATQHVISATEISQSIVRFAGGFLSAGLRPQERILISCGVNPASTLAYLGAMYAGIIPVLVDERTVSASGEQLFIKSKAKAIWTSRVQCSWARQNGFPELRGDFGTDTVASLDPATCTLDDLAVLMPTSGSTGSPRLVMVSHRNLISNTEAIIRSQNLGADEKAMLIMPVSYCFGASVMHTHLYSGGSVVFDSRFMFPDKVLKAIGAYSCTTFAGVPTVYNILLRRSHLSSIRLPALQRFLLAGGALDIESVKQMRQLVPGADFYVMYGQTEATARISCLSPRRLEDKRGSAGLPLESLTVRIINDRGEEAATGHSGEIRVAGPSICGGYFDDPEATRYKFVDGWLRTGDLGSLDEDGYLWIQGRASDFIKVRGYRVSLTEVEAKVAAVPGVCQCAAAGVRHPEAGEAIALFVVGEDGSDNGSQSLLENVRRALPSQWTCASVKLVQEIPRTPNGKIARSKLQTSA